MISSCYAPSWIYRAPLWARRARSTLVSPTQWCTQNKKMQGPPWSHRFNRRGGASTGITRLWQTGRGRTAWWLMQNSVRCTRISHQKINIEWLGFSEVMKKSDRRCWSVFGSQMGGHTERVRAVLCPILSLIWGTLGRGMKMNTQMQLRLIRQSGGRWLSHHVFPGQSLWSGRLNGHLKGASSLLSQTKRAWKCSLPSRASTCLGRLGARENHPSSRYTWKPTATVTRAAVQI